MDKRDILDIKDKSGFFSGWPNKPSEEILLKSILGASHAVLAIDKQKTGQKLAGYITALSDGVLSAYIPFLEVEKSYQKQGIGSTLVEKMVSQLSHLYMVDLVCDKELAGFYEKAGFWEGCAMMIRFYENQSGNASVKIGKR